MLQTTIPCLAPSASSSSAWTRGTPGSKTNHFEAQAQYADVRQAATKALADSDMGGFLRKYSVQIKGLAKETGIGDPLSMKTRLRSHMGTSLGYLVTRLVEPPQAAGALLLHCLDCYVSLCLYACIWQRS